MRLIGTILTETTPSKKVANGTAMDDVIIPFPEVVSPKKSPPSHPHPHPSAEGEEDCNLFVSHLAPAVTEWHLTAAFSKVGPLVSMKLMVHLDTGVSRGFAFVMFERIEDARAAVQRLHGTELCGQAISVRFVDRRLLRHPVVMGSPTKKIFVRNLPIDVTEAALFAVLPQTLTVHELTVSLDRNSSRMQNMAHIVFATVEQAQYAAAALHGTTPFATSVAPILTKVIDSCSNMRRMMAQEERKQKVIRTRCAGPASPTVAVAPCLPSYAIRAASG